MAGTAGTQVTRSRSISASDVSASGDGASTTRAPSSSAACTPGQARGKLWAMGTPISSTLSRSTAAAAAEASEL